MRKIDLEQKLKRLAKESENELIEIGLGDKLKDDITYSINYRAKKRFGQCCEKKYINISSWLLEVGNDHDIKDTIIHEILHTFNDTIAHKEKWQYYARYVNNRTNYNIKRTGSISTIYKNANMTPPQRNINYKWKITCVKCGKVFYKQRLCKKTKLGFENGNMLHKSCGGEEFIIEEL